MICRYAFTHSIRLRPLQIVHDTWTKQNLFLLIGMEKLHKLVSHLQIFVFRSIFARPLYFSLFLTILQRSIIYWVKNVHFLPKYKWKFDSCINLICVWFQLVESRPTVQHRGKTSKQITTIKYFGCFFLAASCYCACCLPRIFISAPSIRFEWLNPYNSFAISIAYTAN